MSYYEYSWGKLAGLGAGEAKADPTSPEVIACTKPCYDSKSVDYNDCRQIPPDKREARDACFKEADERLVACLRVCGVTYAAPNTGLIIAAAGLAALLLLK